MRLTILSIYIFNKVALEKNDNFPRSFYFIDYLYFNSKGQLQAGHTYIDEISFKGLKDFKPDVGSLASNCYKFRGHYENYRFIADELVIEDDFK